MKARDLFKLIICLAICLGVGGFGTVFTSENSLSGWYAQLDKPVFTPPGWVFGPVWTSLYLMMGVAVFLVWRKGWDKKAVRIAMGLFFVQLMLNGLWTPLFFGYHLILAAFIEIIFLWIAIFITFLAFKRLSIAAAVLLVPYLAWVGFAVVLNGSLYYLNRSEADIYDREVSAMSFSENANSYAKLSPEEEAVIVHKGTERPFSGKYYKHKESGVYTCKRCGAELFLSKDKFDSGCGWPSFDDAIERMVKFVPDKDGVRTEIICNNCKGHLGHVFHGERFTEKNTRYCVNSISLNFVAQRERQTRKQAYFAGGCFWGVEYYFQKAKGVISTQVGYMGGKISNPTYADVCTGTTGHAETLEVVYDPAATSYEDLVKLFFEIHDPTQINRQGPDVGHQYRSAIFCTSEEQLETAKKVAHVLKQKGYKLATEITKAGKFWAAEKKHQQYYERKGATPYCHTRKKIF